MRRDHRKFTTSSLQNIEISDRLTRILEELDSAKEEVTQFEEAILEFENFTPSEKKAGVKDMLEEATRVYPKLLELETVYETVEEIKDALDDWHNEVEKFEDNMQLC